MTYSPTCGHCEKSLTPETELAVDYVILPPVLIKIFLHHTCAHDWSRQFGVPLAPLPFDVPALRERIRKMSDSDLSRFETHARYMLTPDAQRPRSEFEQELHESNNEWKRRNLQPHAAKTPLWAPGLRHS